MRVLPSGPALPSRTVARQPALSMAAVVLVGMLSFIASGRVQNVAAMRTITANQLVNEALEQKRAGVYPPSSEAAANVVVAGGTYKREVTTSSTGCPEVRGSFSMDCTNVTATVTFKVTDSGATRQRTASATMRMYR